VTVTLSNHAASLPSPHADALRNLNDLRGRLSSVASTDLERILPSLSTAIDQVVAEHQGMAEELLCLYEQLGIVFEVTRKMAGVQNESQVIELFLESLRRSFEQRAVLVARRQPLGGRWNIEDGPVAVKPDEATKAGASSPPAFEGGGEPTMPVQGPGRGLGTLGDRWELWSRVVQ
jgi:hypothetical protein